jgi:hypothetical protein
VRIEFDLHLLELCASEEEGTDSVDVTAGWLYRPRRGVYGLDRSQAAVGVDVAEQATPGLGQPGFERRMIEQTGIHSPGHGVGEEG